MEEHVLTREAKSASCSCGWMVFSRNEEGVAVLVREHCEEFGIKLSASYVGSNPTDEVTRDHEAAKAWHFEYDGPICDCVDSGYPHPGCAEFGPPDEFFCTETAVWKFVVIDWFRGPNFDAEPCEGDVEDLYACEAHARRELNNAAFNRAAGLELLNIERLEPGEVI